MSGHVALTPDSAWIIGAVVSAVVSAGPAYLALRHSRGTAREEGTATREALSGVRDELRSDIAEIRDWQSGHATDHAIDALKQRGPVRLERRG